MTFCTSCGTPASDGLFCTECGARLVVPEPVEANEPTSVLPAQPPVEAPPAYLPPPPVAPAAPVAYQQSVAPAPVQQPSGGGGRTALIVALVVLLLVGGGIGGVVLWKQQNDDSGTSTATSRDKADEPSTEPSDDSSEVGSQGPEASPVTEPEGEVQCPDGSVVPADANCRVNTATAAMAAFGIDPSQCTASTAGSGHVGAVNLSCLGDQVHVAIYENPQKRLQRLRDYGYESGGCASEPGGIVLCGPTKNGRWVRTYANGTGILLYASVEAEGYAVLSDLDQLTATELIEGVPTS